jgi:hypothetical protein
MRIDDKYINHKHLLTNYLFGAYRSLIGKAIPCSLLSINMLWCLYEPALLGGLECE